MENRILNSDGIKGILDMGKDIDLLITDPPYNISKDSAPKNYYRKDGTHELRTVNIAEWDYNFDENWLEKILPQCRGWVIIFCAHQQISPYIRQLESDGFLAVGCGVWEKTNPMPYNMREKFINSWEAFVYAKRPGTAFYGNMVKNILRHQLNVPNRIHPTQKPLRIFQDLISYTSKKGDLVVDPFAGSGTTNLACWELDRNCLSFELDPAHYKAAKERIRRCTNQTKLVI